MDFVDGKQAVRLGLSSPLGQLFDHGLDTINSSFIVFNSCMIFDLFENTFYVLTILMILFVGFYLNQLDEYYTGKLNTVAFGVGVVEMQLFVAFLYFIKALIKTNFKNDVYKGYNFFDLIFYPLMFSMILLCMTKYLAFYK